MRFLFAADDLLADYADFFLLEMLFRVFCVAYLLKLTGLIVDSR